MSIIHECQLCGNFLSRQSKCEICGLPIGVKPTIYVQRQLTESERLDVLTAIAVFKERIHGIK